MHCSGAPTTCIWRASNSYRYVITSQFVTVELIDHLARSMAQLQITVIALLTVALTAMQGVEAGRYRRVVWGNATVVNGREATDVFGLNATCYNQTMYDFCTLEVIGWMNECLTDIVNSTNCNNGLNLTVTTFFMIGNSMIVTRG